MPYLSTVLGPGLPCVGVMALQGNSSFELFVPMPLFPQAIYGSHDHEHSTWMVEIPVSAMSARYVVRL